MCLQGEEEGSRERSKVMAFPVLSLGGGVFITFANALVTS